MAILKPIRVFSNVITIYVRPQRGDEVVVSHKNAALTS
jgi:hypothetical protein